MSLTLCNIPGHDLGQVRYDEKCLGSTLECCHFVVIRFSIHLTCYTIKSFKLHTIHGLMFPFGEGVDFNVLPLC